MTELNELMHDEGKMLELLQQQRELEKISEDRRELSRTCEELASKMTDGFVNRMSSHIEYPQFVPGESSSS